MRMAGAGLANANWCGSATAGTQSISKSCALTRLSHSNSWCFPSCRCRGSRRACQPTRAALQLFLLLLRRARAAFIHSRLVAACLPLLHSVRLELPSHFLAVIFGLVNGPVRSFRHAEVLYRLIAVCDAPAIHRACFDARSRETTPTPALCRVPG